MRRCINLCRSLSWNVMLSYHVRTVESVLVLFQGDRGGCGAKAPPPHIMRCADASFLLPRLTTKSALSEVEQKKRSIRTPLSSPTHYDPSSLFHTSLPLFTPQTKQKDNSQDEVRSIFISDRAAILLFSREPQDRLRQARRVAEDGGGAVRPPRWWQDAGPR